jgi:hypothetical protein
MITIYGCRNSCVLAVLLFADGPLRVIMVISGTLAGLLPIRGALGKEP